MGVNVKMLGPVGGLWVIAGYAFKGLLNTGLLFSGFMIIRLAVLFWHISLP